MWSAPEGCTPESTRCLIPDFASFVVVVSVVMSTSPKGNKKRLFATTGAKGVRGATLIRYRYSDTNLCRPRPRDIGDDGLGSDNGARSGVSYLRSAIRQRIV